MMRLTTQLFRKSNKNLFLVKAVARNVPLHLQLHFNPSKVAAFQTISKKAYSASRTVGAGPSIAFGPWPVDSVDLFKPHLPRSQLLNQVIDTILNDVPFMVIVGPPALGKSSLMECVTVALETDHKSINGKVVQPVWINIRSHSSSAMTILREQLGLDLNKICGKRVVNGSILADETKHFLVILDDVHFKFGEPEFWMSIIKDPMGLPKNLSFLFCATRSIRISDCPVDLSILPKFDRESFLLDSTEAVQFLEMSADKLSSVPLGVILRDSEVQTVLVNDCGGHVGSLAMSVNALNSRFRNVNEFDAGDVLRFFMSKQIMDELYRCFPVVIDVLPPVMHKLVMRVMCDGCANRQNCSEFTHLLSAPQEIASEDQMVFKTLLNGGILAMSADGSVRFCSPLSRRFMTNKLAFPNRAEKTLPADTSAFQLVRLALLELSANEIAQCVKPGVDFSAEPSWDHLFNAALLSVTPPDIQVCSKIEASFPTDCVDKDHHRADYWISGDKVNIGLELQHNKSTNDTDKASFGPDGKYRKLKVRDWAIVDFRVLGENDTGDKIPRHADKVLVFFRKGDFNRCQAVFGDTKEVEEIAFKP